MLIEVNGQIITQFVLQYLENLWQHSFESKASNVLIHCPDSVAYMLPADKI